MPFSRLYTDEYRPYKSLKSFYSHSFVKHGAGQYVKGKVHTNGIENFWSLFKIDIYHMMSKKHLQRYLNEFVFQFNNKGRSITYLLELVMTGALNNRLSYYQLTRKIV